MSRFTYQYLGDTDQKQDPDILYYNADIISNRTIDQGLGTDPLIKFSETRDVPLINDASKYYFSIIRFTMDGAGKDLPMFIPQIQIGQPNPDLTVYSFTLKCSVNYLIPTVGIRTFTSEKQVYVEFQPESVGAKDPVPPLTRQDFNTKYYFVYTYSHWVDLCNQTLVTALSQIQTDFQTFWTAEGGIGIAPTLTTKVPYLTYSPTTGLFSLYADKYGYGGASRTSITNPNDNENFELYMNSNQFGLLSNFNNLYYGQDNLNGKDNQILFKDILGTNTYTYSGTNYWIAIQDYQSTSSLWCPIGSIVFSTTLIPIIPEQIGEPVRYGESNIVIPYSAPPNFQPIITDIALPLTNAHEYRGFVEYAPQAEYRLSSFTSSRQEVRNIDIQVFWKNRLDGNLYPISMFNLSSVSVKMMFRKKHAGV
jgi:hypothetical protein